MESTCNHVDKDQRDCLMGPYSEAKQYQRAESIQRLIDTNPDLDPLYKAMWKKHLTNLALNETTYNYRVKHVYSLLKPRHRSWVTYGGD